MKTIVVIGMLAVGLSALGQTVKVTTVTPEGNGETTSTKKVDLNQANTVAEAQVAGAVAGAVAATSLDHVFMAHNLKPAKNYHEAYKRCRYLGWHELSSVKLFPSISEYKDVQAECRDWALTQFPNGK
jgi:hypothetical protein